MLPLLGAIVCYGWGGGWRPTLGEWTWCHCWVPLQGANFCFISSSYFQGHQFHPDTQANNNEFCLQLLAKVTLFSTLITQKLVLAIWGLCWYYLMFFEQISCKIFQGRTCRDPSWQCFLCRTTWQWSEVPLCVLFPSPSPLRPTFRSFSEGSQWSHDVETGDTLSAGSLHLQWLQDLVLLNTT